MLMVSYGLRRPAVGKPGNSTEHSCKNHVIGRECGRQWLRQSCVMRRRLALFATDTGPSPQMRGPTRRRLATSEPTVLQRSRLAHREVEASRHRVSRPPEPLRAACLVTPRRRGWEFRCSRPTGPRRTGTRGRACVHRPRRLGPRPAAQTASFRTLLFPFWRPRRGLPTDCSAPPLHRLHHPRPETRTSCRSVCAAPSATPPTSTSKKTNAPSSVVDGIRSFSTATPAA